MSSPYQDQLDRMTWSFSRLNAYHQCPYGWKLHYLDHVEQVGSGFADWGSLCHSIFEDYEKGNLLDFELLDAYEDRYPRYMHNEFPPTRGIPLADRYYERGRELFASFPGFSESWEVLGVELEVAFEIEGKKFLGYTLGAGGVSTGSKGVMTININRLVQNATKDGRDISDAVAEQVQKIHKYLLAYNAIVEDSLNAGLLGVYNAGYISMDKQYLTIGINGFVEGAEFLGIDISPNEQYFEYSRKILEPIYQLNRAAKTDKIMFNTEFVPAENLGVKNAKWDAEDGYVVPRSCYNSYFYKVEDSSCNLLDKFILHGKQMTQYLDGGSALHANLDEHLTFAQYQKVMKDAILTGCPYFTFNIPNTICNACGHISKHRLSHCPKCGSDNLDYATRVIGYLKRVSKYSEARQVEAAKRFYDNGTAKI